ncbi:hypothetical protein DM01DRAFT_1150059 [Hesseltinella vesiculosa]|uniref:DUF3844 domain-containing protein n=1 Tax=Hesseltinella vesiculosa TaxID=101127 RepID=A0A1X2G6U4_9FUNG|nr:hypothetical protein DM01DRAFT_1150059 [Hesseltinella vesiculosa]
MAHWTGTSEHHPVFHWAAVHVQDALDGLEQLWHHSSLKQLPADLFDTSSQHSMVILQGADQHVFGAPSMYVKENNGRSFFDIALDTLGQLVDNAGEKVHTLLGDDTNNQDLEHSFQTHFGSMMDTHLLDAGKKADQTFMKDMEAIHQWLKDKKNSVLELTGLQQLGEEHGPSSKVYQQAHGLIQQVVPSMLEEQGTTVVVTPFTHRASKRAPQEKKVDIVSDFQLLFWTGVLLVLVTFGVLSFMYQLGSSTSSGVVLTATSLPKQD